MKIATMSVWAAAVALVAASVPLQAAIGAGGDTKQDDAKVLSQLYEGNNDEIQAGQLGEKKAASPAAKQLAQTLVKDHEALQKKVEAAAKAENISLAQAVDANSQAQIAKPASWNSTSSTA